MAQGRDDKDASAVLQDLRKRTRIWANNPDGLSETRTELMDSVDRGLLHRGLMQLDPDTVQTVLDRMPELPASSTDLARLIAANELRTAVIRNWAGRYYGDRAQGDWFDAYCRAAEMRQASAARDLERLAGEPTAAIQNHIDAAIRGLNTSLRLRLLQAPRGRKIGHRSLQTRLRQFLGLAQRQPVNESSGTLPPSST
ncbi:MAG: hypothetical protein L0I62_01430 [Gammaproteobacteria bacterium]|nr:hypothetical protein [Gammaproteobacteria bacterium]